MTEQQAGGKPFGTEIALLRQQGQRVTPQRLQVLHLLRNVDRPMTAEEIAASIATQQPMDMATIYRVLHCLHQAGLAALLTPEQGRQRYKYREPGDCHHHLVCQHCGREAQIPDEALEPLRAALVHHYQFALQIDHLLLPGYCAHCQSDLVFANPKHTSQSSL
jgi:Fur family transcriptional regulator, ferric uptake regulator